MEEKRSVEAVITLHEGVLNDDTLELLKPQYVYTGRNNAVCKITYWTYANEWSNNKHERYFKSVKNARKWYQKEMKERVILQGGVWLAENPADGEEETAEELAELLANYSTAVDKMTPALKKKCVNEWESITCY